MPRFPAADFRGSPVTAPSSTARSGRRELSGGIRLAERLAEQRVRTTLEVWPGMFHVWHLFAGRLAEADEALDNAVTFLTKEYLRPG